MDSVCLELETEILAYDNTICPFCGQKNSSHMYWVGFCNNRRVRVHAACIFNLGGLASTVQWLEKNAIFRPDKKLSGFKKHPENQERAIAQAGLENARGC